MMRGQLNQRNIMQTVKLLLSRLAAGVCVGVGYAPNFNVNITDAKVGVRVFFERQLRFVFVTDPVGRQPFTDTQLVGGFQFVAIRADESLTVTPTREPNRDIELAKQTRDCGSAYFKHLSNRGCGHSLLRVKLNQFIIVGVAEMARLATSFPNGWRLDVILPQPVKYRRSVYTVTSGENVVAFVQYTNRIINLFAGRSENTSISQPIAFRSSRNAVHRQPSAYRNLINAELRGNDSRAFTLRAIQVFKRFFRRPQTSRFMRAFSRTVLAARCFLSIENLSAYRTRAILASFTRSSNILTNPAAAKADRSVRWFDLEWVGAHLTVFQHILILSRFRGCF